MEKVRRFIVVGALIGGVGGALLPASNAYAVSVFDQCAGANADTAICKAKDDNAANMITIIINTLLVVLGMIAVIMIVIGGIRYTTSNGDPGGIKSAKDTIIYSVVGLVVAIMSFAIVNFVVGRFIQP